MTVDIILLLINEKRDLVTYSLIASTIFAKMKIKNPERICCISVKIDEMVPDGNALADSNEIVMDVYGHNNLHFDHEGTYQFTPKIV